MLLPTALQATGKSGPAGLPVRSQGLPGPGRLRPARWNGFPALLPVLVLLLLGGTLSGMPVSAKISQVFVVPLSHLDVGFTATPAEVAADYARDLEFGLRAIANLDGLCWNIESVWQLEQWLQVDASGAKRELLQRLMADGKLGIGAAYATPHSSLMTGEEMLRFFYPAGRLRRELGVPIQTAVLNDVPGFAAFLPQALAASGVRYLIAGNNLSFGGGTSIPIRKMPFYWVGPDGSAVLTWVSKESYLEGIFYWELHKGSYQAFAQKVRALERKGYPYDAILIIDGYGDNAEMTPILSRKRVLERWAELPGSIRVRYSTVSEFFHYIEEKYGDSFPAYRGDWGRSWEVSRVAGPWQMARYRNLQNRLPAVETLAAMASLAKGVEYPEAKLERAWENLRLLAEHSAAPGTGWPGLTSKAQVEESNRAKASYVLAAERIVDGIEEDALSALFAVLRGTGLSRDAGSAHAGAEHAPNDASRGQLAPGYAKMESDGGPSRPDDSSGVHDVLVYNPLSWTRSAFVRVAVPQGQGDLGRETLQAVDLASGARYDTWRVGDAIAFHVPALPPLGWARYALVNKDRQGPGALPGVQASPAAEEGPDGPAEGSAGRGEAEPDGRLVCLESRWYRVVVDTRRGWITSFYDKEHARELCNAESKYRFNQLLTAPHRQDFMGGAPDLVVPEVAEITRLDQPGSAGLEVRYRAGTPWVRTRIRLSSVTKQVEIENTLTRSGMSYVPLDRHSDHYYFAFPFQLALPGLKVRYLGAGGFQFVADDVLPGANANSIISRAVVDLRDHHFGVTVAHREAFAFSVGGIGHRGPLFLPAEPTLFSHVVQKIDEGETKDQGVAAFTVEPQAPDQLTFSYAFSSGPGSFDPVVAFRFGLEWITPVSALVLPPDCLLSCQVGPGELAPAPLEPQSMTDGAEGEDLSQFLASRPRGSFAEVDAPNAVVTALKRAAFGDCRDLILRIQEIAGQETLATVRTAFPVIWAERTTALEEPTGEDVPHSPLRIAIKPFETVTLRLTVARDASWRE